MVMQEVAPLFVGSTPTNSPMDQLKPLPIGGPLDPNPVIVSLCPVMRQWGVWNRHKARFVQYFAIGAELADVTIVEGGPDMPEGPEVIFQGRFLSEHVQGTAEENYKTNGKHVVAADDPARRPGTKYASVLVLTHLVGFMYSNMVEKPPAVS